MRLYLFCGVLKKRTFNLAKKSRNFKLHHSVEMGFPLARNRHS